MSLSCLNLFIIIPLNSLSGSSSMLLSLGIITMELVMFGRDMLSFFLCVVYIFALRLLHQKLVDCVSFSFLPFFLLLILHSFFFLPKLLLCMEAVAMFREY